MALKWYFVSMKGKKNFSISFDKIQHAPLPIVEEEEFKKMLENIQQTCYKQKNIDHCKEHHQCIFSRKRNSLLI